MFLRKIHTFLFYPDYIILSVSDLLNKAKFKARRGSNELDKILVPFVEKKFLSLEKSQIDQLFELFEIDDVSLADIIIYKTMEHPIELKEIFEEIFDFYSEI